MTAYPLAAVVGCSTGSEYVTGTATNFAAGFSGVPFSGLIGNAILAGGVILIIQWCLRVRESVRCELLVPVRRYAKVIYSDFSDYPFSTDWHHVVVVPGIIMAILLALAPVMLYRTKWAFLPLCVAVCG